MFRKQRPQVYLGVWPVVGWLLCVIGELHPCPGIRGKPLDFWQDFSDFMHMMDGPTIFISHIQEEKEIANAVKEFLERRFSNTIQVFASSHEDSLRLGDDWMGTIKRSMEAAELIIILCSPVSISRPWINFEAGGGWIRGVPVIPLCHSGLHPDSLPAPLSSFQGGVLNDAQDMAKVFKQVAGFLAVAIPDVADASFFSALDSFEQEIKDSVLYKDTKFIQRLLHQQVETLKYSVLASTLSYDQLQKVNLNKEGFKNHQFTFNDVYHLFNFSLSITLHRRKIFEIFHATVHELAKDIKFVLTYSRINIAPPLIELFEVFLFSVSSVDRWFQSIYFQDQQVNKELKELPITMIKAEPLPPTRRFSNIINDYIAYYESLLAYQEWVVEYEKIVDGILTKNKADSPAKE